MGKLHTPGDFHKPHIFHTERGSLSFRQAIPNSLDQISPSLQRYFPNARYKSLGAVSRCLIKVGLQPYRILGRLLYVRYDSKKIMPGLDPVSNHIKLSSIYAPMFTIPIKSLCILSVCE